MKLETRIKMHEHGETFIRACIGFALAIIYINDHPGVALTIGLLFILVELISFKVEKIMSAVAGLLIRKPGDIDMNLLEKALQEEVNSKMNELPDMVDKTILKEILVGIFIAGAKYSNEIHAKNYREMR